MTITQFPKRFSRNHCQKSPHIDHIDNIRLHALSVNEDDQNEELHASELSLKTPYSGNNRNS